MRKYSDLECCSATGNIWDEIHKTHLCQVIIGIPKVIFAHSFEFSLNPGEIKYHDDHILNGV